MGGIARYATVSLCLPPDLTLGWVDSLYDGLLERAAESGVALVGGNVTRGRESIVVDVTLLGDSGRLLLRAGARPGDRVVVTGRLGAAAEGVRLLAEGARLDEDGGAPRHRGVDGVLGARGPGLPSRPARPAPAARARPLDRRARPRAGGDGPLGRPVARPRRDLLAQRGRGGDRGLRGARRPEGGGARAGAGRRRARPRAARRRGLPAPPRGRRGGARRARRARAGLGCRGRGGGRVRRRRARRAPARRGRGAAARAGRRTTTSGRGRPSRGDRACGGCAGRGRSCSTSRTAPREWPLAFALGVFIAFFPLLGIHTGLAIVIAIAFRLNKAAILVGAWTNNPWTIAPMYTRGHAPGLLRPRRVAREPRRDRLEPARAGVLRVARRRPPPALCPSSWATWSWARPPALVSFLALRSLLARRKRTACRPVGAPTRR